MFGLIEQSKCVCRDYELPVRRHFGSLRSGSRTGSKVEGGPKRANASFRTTLFPVFEHH
jgi:hypothetical protein